MRYQQDLQVQLRERLRRLMTCGYGTYGHEAVLTVNWLRSQPAIRGVLDETATAEPDVTVEAWIAACDEGRGLVWPTTTEAGRARLIWTWMQTVTDDEEVILGFGYTISSTSNINDAARNLTEAVVMPLFDYISEKISSESNVLYLLERYVRRIEFFDRQALYDRYIANTRQGEAIYDADLRRFLFDQGLNMPFSQPKSASGLSDVIGELDTDDPLVCEVKVFDAASHDKRGIVSGVNQVLNYAHDYGKSVAYLVIINLSGRPLELPTDSVSKNWPPYVDLSGVRVNLINVRAMPVVSASKLGKAKPVVMSRQDLIDPDL